MNYNRGDQIVHHSFGVGTVASIERMNFPGNRPGMYYRMEFSRTTVWVSVDNQPTAGLRRITPKDQLYRFRALLKSSPVVLNADFRTRQNDLENRVEAGDFRSLCEIVRDLSALYWLKPLNQYEKTMLKRSRASLAEEWSATSGLAVNEALDEIEGYLLKGRQNVSALNSPI